MPKKELSVEEKAKRIFKKQGWRQTKGCNVWRKTVHRPSPTLNKAKSYEIAVFQDFFRTSFLMPIVFKIFDRLLEEAITHRHTADFSITPYGIDTPIGRIKYNIDCPEMQEYLGEDYRIESEAIIHAIYYFLFEDK